MWKSKVVNKVKGFLINVKNVNNSIIWKINTLHVLKGLLKIAKFTKIYKMCAVNVFRVFN